MLKVWKLEDDTLISSPPPLGGDSLYTYNQAYPLGTDHLTILSGPVQVLSFDRTGLAKRTVFYGPQPYVMPLVTQPGPAGSNSFASAPTISVPGQSQPTLNAGFGVEAGERMPAGWSQLYRSAWWRLTASETGPIIVDTNKTVDLGNYNDTVLTVWSGSSLADLVEVANDDDGGIGGASWLTFQAQAGVTYYVQVCSWGNYDMEYVLSVAPGTPDGLPITWDYNSQDSTLSRMDHDRVMLQDTTSQFLGGTIVSAVGGPHITSQGNYFPENRYGMAEIIATHTDPDPQGSQVDRWISINHTVVPLTEGSGVIVLWEDTGNYSSDDHIFMIPYSDDGDTEFSTDQSRMRQLGATNEWLQGECYPLSETTFCALERWDETGPVLDGTHRLRAYDTSGNLLDRSDWLTRYTSPPADGSGNGQITSFTITIQDQEDGSIISFCEEREYITFSPSPGYVRDSFFLRRSTWDGSAWHLGEKVMLDMVESSTRGYMVQFQEFQPGRYFVDYVRCLQAPYTQVASGYTPYERVLLILDRDFKVTDQYVFTADQFKSEGNEFSAVCYGHYGLVGWNVYDPHLQTNVQTYYLIQHTPDLGLRGGPVDNRRAFWGGASA